MCWQIYLSINLLSVPLIYSFVIGTTDSDPFDLGLGSNLDVISTTFDPSILNNVAVNNDFTTSSSDFSSDSNQQNEYLQASYEDTVGLEKLDGEVGSGVTPGVVDNGQAMPTTEGMEPLKDEMGYGRGMLNHRQVLGEHQWSPDHCDCNHRIRIPTRKKRKKQTTLVLPLAKFIFYRLKIPVSFPITMVNPVLEAYMGTVNALLATRVICWL